jgi:hypothetical protein
MNWPAEMNDVRNMAPRMAILMPRIGNSLACRSGVSDYSLATQRGDERKPYGVTP